MTPNMQSSDANASGDINALIDSSIDSVSAEPSTPAVDTPAESTDSPEEPAELPPVEEAQPDQPEAQPEQAEQETEPEETIEDEDDLSQPDRVSKDGKLHYYRPQRIQKFLQSHHAWQEVQNAIPGATVDQLKDYQATAAAADEMLSDFHSGDPAKVDKILDFYRNENPDAFPLMALRAARSIYDSSPQAAQVLDKFSQQRLINTLYQDARTRGDQNALLLAQHLDNRLNGRFQKQEELSARDDLAEREAAIARREQELQQRSQTEMNTRREAWLQQTDSLVESTINSAIDQALPQAVREAFKDKPQLKWIANELRDKIAETRKSNPAWERQFNALRERAKTMTSEEMRGSLVSMMRQFAQQVIAKNRKAVIEAATGTVMSQSAKAHQKQAAAAAKREPTNAGAPINSSNISEKLKKAQSMDEVWKAIGF